MDHPALLQLNKEKWLYIFENAFGITEFKEISLSEAQSLIANIAQEITSEPFLRKVDETIGSLSKDATLVEKRQALISILFPIHMAVMEKHGFAGETGYIQAQSAIMDYYHDPLIKEKAMEAQTIVFKRAGLM